MIRRRDLGAGALLAPMVLTSGAAAQPAAAPESLDALLRPSLGRYGLPAFAAAVVSRGEIVAAGAVGTRRAGAEVPVTLNDRFHIGSDTKAMTALLAGTFVEQGALRWDSTVAAVFPDLSPTMHPDLRLVTLRQLLSHTSGIPPDNQTFIDLMLQVMGQDSLNLDEMRLWLLREWRGQKLVSTPGGGFAYSNLNYVIAGAMTERVSGRTWEELLVDRVFVPLGLTTAGFGPQASLGRVDAPLGHLIRPDGTLKPMLGGPDGDNPAVIGPAGTVHLSILDFAAWAGWNAGEGRRGPALVRPETVRLLHTKVIEMPTRPGAAPGTPSIGGYGLGWGVVSMPWAQGPLITHTGSNQMNLAMIWLDPARDFAMVMATNVGGPKADQALKAAAEALYRQYAGAA